EAERHRRGHLVVRELAEELGAARELAVARGEHRTNLFPRLHAGVCNVQGEAIEQRQTSPDLRVNESDLRRGLLICRSPDGPRDHWQGDLRLHGIPPNRTALRRRGLTFFSARR